MEDDPKPTSPEESNFQRLWSELKRRHVVRVAITYAVVGWVIMQVAGLTFEGFGIPIWAFRFVMVMVILGFPLAIILAWAFELTPEGIKTSKTAREEHPDSHKNVSHAKKRHWFAIAFAAAVPTVIFGALALFFFIRSGDDAQDFEGDQSIAVLPFDNRSSLDEDLFFIKGVHDGLSTQISRIPGIRTVGRTSVMVYQDTTKNVKTIGRELGVATLLEGSVQRAGNEVRITVELRDAAADAHMWSERYTRELTATNIFEIQDEITKKIADAMKLILSLEEQRRIEKLPTENLTALVAYFRGMESLRKLTGPGQEEASEYFEKAISLDPNFALAHAMLARSMFGARGSGSAMDPEAATHHIGIALDLDDTISEAYSALGRLRTGERELELAEEAYKRAIQLDPNNAEAHQYYAVSLKLSIGGTSKVAELYRKAYELDPMHDQAQDRLAGSFEALGQWEESIKARKRWVARNPENSTAHLSLGSRFGRSLGHWDEAIVELRKALAPRRTPNPFRGISGAYAMLGDTNQAIEWMDRLMEGRRSSQRRTEGLRSGLRLIQWECYRLDLIGDDDARKESALEGLKKFPEDGELLGHLTDLYVASGQAEDIRSGWEQAYPAFFDASPAVIADNRFYAKDVARVLMATDEREQADRLIKAALAFLKTQAQSWGILSLEASLHAVAGDDDQALDAIRRCLEAGGSPYGLMMEDELKRFEDKPEYEAMAAKRKAELAEQLERINEMEANGELASILGLPTN